MRLPLFTVSLTFVFAVLTSSLFAQEPSLQERIAVRRELEVAKMNLRYYWRVEYPRQCRDLDAAIECARADVESNRILLREYGPFTRFTIGQPFPVTIRNLQMCIRADEVRLNNLIDERNALIRYHSDQFRVLAGDVYAARARIAELEADLPPRTESTEPLPVQR